MCVFVTVLYRIRFNSCVMEIQPRILKCCQMLPNQSKYEFKSCYTVKETAVHFTNLLDVG